MRRSVPITGDGSLDHVPALRHARTGRRAGPAEISGGRAAALAGEARAPGVPAHAFAANDASFQTRREDTQGRLRRLIAAQHTFGGGV